ncbi:unknown [Anaerotruncus sp. CAG:390]|nr:unknown [Anaerotruncus sp. CAG:390]
MPFSVFVIKAHKTAYLLPARAVAERRVAVKRQKSTQFGIFIVPLYYGHDAVRVERAEIGVEKALLYDIGICGIGCKP